MSDKSPQKRILVVIPTSTLTQRQLLEGLLEYAHESASGPWQFHLDLHDLNRQRMKDLKSWGCQGIIAYILSDRERQDFIATGLPAVFIEPTRAKPPPQLPLNVVTFINEHAAEGRTAADYFIARRYRSFAYVGTAKPTFWSGERMMGFAERLGADGFSPVIYPSPPPEEQNDFALESRRLTKWLRRLPRQTALFCVHDRRAQQVVATAVAAGLRIPEDIAVLGVDNDELLCEMTVPAISSIPVNDHARGLAVGAAMDCLLERRPVKRVHVTRHDAVITRTSTEAQAVADPFVARAVSYACAHLAERPTLLELAKAAGCSKTVLNLHARRTFGHTISDELTRHRVNAAIERLADAGRTVEEVAQACGFCSASHLGLRLKAVTGHTPAYYRRRQFPQA
jgi:LacI family transcriptional regulator